MEDNRERDAEGKRRTSNEPANHVTTGRGWQATFRMLRTPQAAAYRTPSRYPSQGNNSVDCVRDIKNPSNSLERVSGRRNLERDRPLRFASTDSLKTYVHAGFHGLTLRVIHG